MSSENNIQDIQDFVLHSGRALRGINFVTFDGDGKGWTQLRFPADLYEGHFGILPAIEAAEAVNIVGAAAFVRRLRTFDYTDDGVTDIRLILHRETTVKSKREVHPDDTIIVRARVERMHPAEGVALLKGEVVKKNGGEVCFEVRTTGYSPWLRNHAGGNGSEER